MTIGGVEHAGFREGFKAVPSHQRAGLIAGEQLHVALAVAAAHAHAVAVRIGADDDVSALLLGLIHGHLQGGGIFRVGGFDGGEAAIAHILSGHGGEAEAQAAQQLRHHHAASPVQSREDQLEAAGCGVLQQLGAQHHRLHTSQVGLVHGCAKWLDAALLLLRQRLPGLLNDAIDLGDDPAGVGFNNAGTVIEVDLVAVVVRRVVAGGDHDAGIGTELAHGVAHQRRSPAFFNQMHIGAVLAGNPCGKAGKLRGKQAGVVADDNGGQLALTAVGAPGSQIGHQTAGRTGDVVVVHRVGAHAGMLRGLALGGVASLSGADHAADGPAAQAAGAKLQRLVESIVEFFPVATLSKLFNGLEIKGLAAGRQQGTDVLQAAGKESAALGGGFEGGIKVHG